MSKNEFTIYDVLYSLSRSGNPRLQEIARKGYEEQREKERYYKEMREQEEKLQRQAEQKAYIPDWVRANNEIESRHYTPGGFC
jgi:hypothetical protein